MTPLHLQLSPRDGMFLKDGRGWFSNQAGTPSTFEWPSVATVRGAIRTAYARSIEHKRGEPLRVDAHAGRNDWRDLTASIRLGPMLALCQPLGSAPQSGHRMWPRPLDAVLTAGPGADLAWRRLEPGASPVTLHSEAGNDSAAMRSLLWPSLPSEHRDKPVGAPPFLIDADFDAWLCGEIPPYRRTDPLPNGMQSRVDVHLAIDPMLGVGRDAMLFATRTLEPLACDERKAAYAWSLCVQVEGAETEYIDRRLVTLGADRKPARATVVHPEVFAAPGKLLNATKRLRPRGLRLVVIGPAWFDCGWRPASLKPGPDGYTGSFGPIRDIRLRAACVGRPQHVSGWDMHKGQPKPTRRLVPPGSVYYLEKLSHESFTPEEVASLWLAPVGDREDDSQCYGHVVAGLWTTHPTS